MDLIQQRQGSSPGRASFDGYAIARGWIVTVGLWLVIWLAVAVYFDVTRDDQPTTMQLDHVSFWWIFAAVSILVAMFAGLPLALILDRVLRGVQVPWLHVAAFFVFFTLLPAVLFIRGTEQLGPYPFLGCAVLGACAAIGRAAAFRRGRAFRRPTTWS